MAACYATWDQYAIVSSLLEFHIEFRVLFLFSEQTDGSQLNERNISWSWQEVPKDDGKMVASVVLPWFSLRPVRVDKSVTGGRFHLISAEPWEKSQLTSAPEDRWWMVRF